MSFELLCEDPVGANTLSIKLDTFNSFNGIRFLILGEALDDDCELLGDLPESEILSDLLALDARRRLAIGEDHQPIAKRLRASNASKSLKISDSGKSPSSSQSSSKASPRIRKRIPLKELNVSTERNRIRRQLNSTTYRIRLRSVDTFNSFNGIRFLILGEALDDDCELLGDLPESEILSDLLALDARRRLAIGEDHQPIAKRLRASNASKSLKISDSGKSPSSSQSSSKASPRIRKRIPLKELNVSTERNRIR
ncbi:unnamed protein product [Trichobilharzia szidati]|nr:unnamed protein product [Trichobilharzia szidati]